MGEKKKHTGAVMVLYILCAVIWDVRVVLDITVRGFIDSPGLFAMNLLCAILWTVSAVLQVLRHRRERGGK